MNWYLKCLKQYADFSGRARRKEFWMFVLLNIIFSIAIEIIDDVLGSIVAKKGYGSGMFNYIYAFAMFIPVLAVTVRRLHDIGKSGWMIFIPYFLLPAIAMILRRNFDFGKIIYLIPLVGVIWFINLMTTDSQKDTNKWGENPKVNTE